jgi:hypothetical protein
MKKKTEKPVPKQINDLEEFQAAYGEQWMNITRMPVFRAGLQLLNVRKLNEITSLSNEEIEKHAAIILSELLGLLRHENAIFGLHEEKTFKFPLEDDEEYFSPEQVAQLEQQKAKFREQAQKQRYA